MPFLEILTRTFGKRARLLANNRRSLQAQTDPDFIATLLVDEFQAGVGLAQVMLADYAHKLAGDYIWVLDDDDECTRPSLVAELKTIVAEHNPDVIVVKMDHGPRGVLPAVQNWGKRPCLAQIGSSGVIVRRSVWQAHADAFRSARYTSDFDFIDAVWNSEPAVYWHDVIASKVQMIGLGQKEPV